MLSATPGSMLKTMFRSSCDADRRLLDTSGFASTVAAGLRACLGSRYTTYRQELQAYVEPWAATLDAVACPVEIFQGEADDWTPPSMAAALQARLGAKASLTRLPGLGHYSTLKAACETQALWRTAG